VRAAGRLELVRLAVAAILAGRPGGWSALVRALEVLLGLRRLTPRPGEVLPDHSVEVVELDTGGGFRAAYRMQDPAKDPREPGGGESSSRGNDHGWSNCTMSSGAMALAYQQPRGSKAPWGGDLRHRQSDLEGGTDLNDVKQAWADYGETLSIRSGQGWSEVVDCHKEGRAIVIQGEGNVPGSESFDGGHGCVIAPETHSSGDWLFGDPLASGWQWVSVSSIRSWAERWQTSIAFAVGEKPPDDPDPEEPGGGGEPAPDSTPYGPNDLERARTSGDAAGYRRGRQAGRVEVGDEAVGSWLDWLRAPAPGSADVWDGGAWSPVDVPELDELARALADEVDPCVDPEPPVVLAAALWSRGRVLSPVSDAYAAEHELAVWGEVGWRERVWR